MKFRELKYSLAIAALFFTSWCLSLDESGYTFSEEKTYKKAYKVDNGASVDISNKYGQVVISTWSKDSVRFEVEVVSQGDKLDKVMENLNAVEVDFMGNSQYVEGKTNWANNVGFFKKSVTEIRQSLKSSIRVQINYKVYMPENCDLNIENHFGDVYLGDLTGDLQADISHGNFRAGDLAEVRRLKMKYGDVRIKFAEEANIDISFGELEVAECGDLQVSAGTAEVFLDEIGDIQLFAKNSQVDIQSVSVLSGTMSLSDIKVRKLSKRINVNSKFGSFHLMGAEPGFEKVDLNGVFTDYFVITEGTMNAKFKVTLESGKDFSYSENVNIDSHDTLDRTDIYAGVIGNGGTAEISIRAKNGYVQFDM